MLVVVVVVTVGEEDVPTRLLSGGRAADAVVLVDVVAVEEMVDEAADSLSRPVCAVTDVLVITTLAVFAVTPPSGLASTELAVSIDEVVVTTTPGAPAAWSPPDTKLDVVEDDVGPELGSGRP